MLFLQCLHCCRSGVSSSGRPVAKASRAISSRGLTTGPGEATDIDAESSFFDFLSSGAHIGQSPSLVSVTRFSQLTFHNASFPPISRLIVLGSGFLELNRAVRFVLGVLLRCDLDRLLVVCMRKLWLVYCQSCARVRGCGRITLFGVGNGGHRVCRLFRLMGWFDVVMTAKCDTIAMEGSLWVVVCVATETRDINVRR